MKGLQQALVHKLDKAYIRRSLSVTCSPMAARWCVKNASFGDVIIHRELIFTQSLKLSPKIKNFWICTRGEHIIKSSPLSKHSASSWDTSAYFSRNWSINPTFHHVIHIIPIAYLEFSNMRLKLRNFYGSIIDPSMKPSSL